MASRYQIEAFDRSLRDVCKGDDRRLEHVPYDGKILIFGGDFRQTYLLFVTVLSIKS